MLDRECPPGIRRLPGADAVMWSQRPDTRDLLNLKSCELKLRSAEKLVGEALAGLAPMAALVYPYQGDLLGRLSAMWGVAEEGMALTAGSTSAIAAVVDALAVPAGRLVLQEPAFTAWEHQARLRGLEVARCRGVTGGPPRTTIRDLEAGLESDRPAVVALTNPSNPLGDLLPRAQIERLAGLAGTHGHVLVVDECYGQFSGADHVSLIADHPNLVVIRSLSKAWGMAGARLAVTFGHPGVVAYLQKFHLSAPVSGLAIALAERLSERAGELAGVWSEMAGTRSWFATEIARRHPGWTPLLSVTNFVTVATSVPGTGTRVERLLGEHGVRIRGLDGIEGFEGCWRISMTDREELERVLRILDDAGAAR